MSNSASSSQRLLQRVVSCVVSFSVLRCLVHACSERSGPVTVNSSKAYGCRSRALDPGGGLFVVDLHRILISRIHLRAPPTPAKRRDAIFAPASRYIVRVQRPTPRGPTLTARRGRTGPPRAQHATSGFRASGGDYGADSDTSGGGRTNIYTACHLTQLL